MGTYRGPPGDCNQHWHVVSAYHRVDEPGSQSLTRNFFELGSRYTQVIINEENMHDTKDTIERRLTAVKSQRSSGELEDLALIIGTFLLKLDVFDD